jgi:acyl-CoA thioester hydrolase
MRDNSTTPWPDLAGRLTPEGHVLPVRVYFEDTDFSGVVYHGAYIRFFERGRSDLVRVLGVTHTELAEDDDRPAAFAVRRMTVDFLKPARIDDVLEVVTRASVLAGASITLSQTIRRGTETLVTAEVKVALVSPEGRALRIRGSLRERLGGA